MPACRAGGDGRESDFKARSDDRFHDVAGMAYGQRTGATSNPIENLRFLDVSRTNLDRAEMRSE